MNLINCLNTWLLVQALSSELQAPGDAQIWIKAELLVLGPVRIVFLYLNLQKLCRLMLNNMLFTIYYVFKGERSHGPPH